MLKDPNHPMTPVYVIDDVSQRNRKKDLSSRSALEKLKNPRNDRMIVRIGVAGALAEAIVFALELLFCYSYFTNIERPCASGVLSHIDANNHFAMSLGVQQVFIRITVRYLKNKNKNGFVNSLLTEIFIVIHHFISTGTGTISPRRRTRSH